jgi:hypothetical protein
MRRSLPWIAAVIVSLSGLAQARERTPAFPRDTAVLVVGEVTSPPKTRLGEQKLQVAIGPEHTDYTLHFFGAQVLGVNGRPLDEGDFRHGMWIRAEGRIMNDPRRVKVSRLQVIASDRSTLAHSALLPMGQAEGYITSVAGVRETFPEDAAAKVRPSPTVIVSRVGQDYRPLDLTAGFTVQAAGADWRLELPADARLVDRQGGMVGAQEIAPGQWVCVYGWRTGDLRLRVARVEQIGKSARRSRHYRANSPLGYAESAEPSTLEQVTLRGVVRKVDAGSGYLTLRTSEQREQRVWLPAAEITVRNRIRTGDYRVGDEVEVSITTFR